MKLSEQWLRKWANPPINITELAEQLTMAGLEVESVTPVAGAFNNVIIGKVIKAEQHPNADRLRVCQVDVGQTELLNIVCGAANVRADLKVAVAMIGATLPGDFQIKAAKLRGVPSQGMICSAAELQLQESSEGIIELPTDAPIGVELREWLQLDDHVLDVHLTPNRGDCLSVLGLAREISVLNHCPLIAPNWQEVPATITEQLPVTIEATAACPRYLGRVIKGINPTASAPVWLTECLRRSGLKSIHPVVDVTNYVLLELGQPMHAFDLSKLQDGITVRFAHPDEHLTLLDEQKVPLDKKTLVIADAKQALAIAGVMGGLDSAVQATTTELFLESAFFNPLIITGQARQYGLETDSAYRFERGIDPELQRRAIERATQLLLEIVGGQAGPISERSYPEHLPVRAMITLRKKRLERVLGITMPTEKISAILQQLGMEIVQTENDIWQIKPPSYRYDLTIEEDVIEELARIYGYQNIAPQQPQIPLTFLPQPEQQLGLKRLRNLLVDRGYHEAITYSFISPKLQQLIDPQQAGIALSNPISAELSVMRTSLWPGLLNAVLYNQNRQQTRVRLFETGLRFIPQGNEVSQEAYLAGVITGDAYPEQWGEPQRAVDFFAMKNDLEALIRLTGNLPAFSWQKAEHAALHPGKTSAILFEQKIVGYLGALHPGLLETLDLIGPVYLFEIQLAALTAAVLPKFVALSKFPAIRRDISFWVAKTVSIQAILDQVRSCAGEWLNDLCLFDVYQSKDAADDKRSLALGLIWQHPTRTLVDDEINTLMDSVITALKQTFAINLRE